MHAEFVDQWCPIKHLKALLITILGESTKPLHNNGIIGKSLLKGHKVLQHRPAHKLLHKVVAKLP